jgi:hypothetical protein
MGREISEPVPRRARANYLLERGTWRATCQICGWAATDPNKRRAVSVFRGHIVEGCPVATIDLTDSLLSRPIALNRDLNLKR